MTGGTTARPRRIVAVTGATGFVGHRVVEVLLARGHEVRGLARDPARWGTPVRGLTLATFDLESTAPEAARSALQGVDALVHAAAYLPPSYDDPTYAERCLRLNALATLSLLDVARSLALSSFVYLSSGNIYAPQARPVTEDDPIYPSARAPFYLASKVCGDTWVEHYRQRHGLCAAVLRLASVYGPGMTRGGMVGTFASKLRAGEPVVLQDGGRFRADLVYVDDVAESVVQAVERQATGVFNVGSGAAPSALDVATTLAELLGRPASQLTVEPATENIGAAGYAPLSIGRARDALGYAPRSARDGLSAYVASLPP
jgi:UDP-glucose 4-epimerase